MYTKQTLNAKRILIETEHTETLRIRVTGPSSVQAFCLECGTAEEMIDLNSAADISGAKAREILLRVESGELHSPEISSGHLLICRASLEHSINSDSSLRPALLEKRI